MLFSISRALPCSCEHSPCLVHLSPVLHFAVGDRGRAVGRKSRVYEFGAGSASRGASNIGHNYARLFLCLLFLTSFLLPFNGICMCFMSASAASILCAMTCLGSLHCRIIATVGGCDCLDGWARGSVRVRVRVRIRRVEMERVWHVRARTGVVG